MFGLWLYHSDTVRRRNREDTRRRRGERRIRRSGTRASTELGREDSISTEGRTHALRNVTPALTGLTYQPAPARRARARVWGNATASVVTMKAANHYDQSQYRSVVTGYEILYRIRQLNR